MDKEVLLSEYINRHKGVGADKLNAYVDLFVLNLVEGGILSGKSREFIVDFIQTLSDQFLSMKTTAYRESQANAKLQKELKELKTKVDQQKHSGVPVETTLDVVNEQNSRDAWEFENIQKVDLSKLVKKPRYFDGNEPLPREWIEEYKDAIEDNRWNEETAVYYFRHFLSKDASSWFKLNVRPKINNNFKWSELFKEFEANYLGRAEEDRVRLMLNKTTMSYDDRVANFIPRVQRMIRILNPEISEKEEVDKISEKLRADYAAAIVDKEPQTVEELRNICRKVEAAADLRRASIANNRVDNGNKNLRNRFQPPRSKGKEQSSQNNKERKCFRCNRNNHLVKDCRAMTKLDGTTIPEERKAPVTKKAIRSISAIADEKEDEQEVRVLCGAILTSMDKNQNNMLAQYVTCNGIPIKAIVDSGAWMTVIDEKLARNNNWSIAKTTKQAIGAGSQPLIIVGEAKLEISLIINGIKKIKFHTCLIVRDLATPMLLGADLLVSFDIVVDLPNHCLDYAKHFGPGLRMVNRRTIPARTQMMVQTYAPVIGEILTINYNFCEELMVANSVCEVKANIAPVVVMNLSKNNIALEKGLRIASYERINFPKAVPIMAMLKIPDSEEFLRIGDQLSEEQIKDIKHILNANVQAFSINGELGCSHIVKHKIEIEPNTRPIMEPLRRRPLIQIEETRKQVKDMKEKGIIEDSTSPWASAYVVVKKKTGEMRICIDFRKLNAVTKKNAYPLPRIDTCLDVLAGKKFFSSFDFASGYWQLEMDNESKEYTAFRTEDGHYQFKRMPFGLTNAPASFQRLMNTMLAGVKGLDLQVYLDDVCLATNSWAEHCEMLGKFLSLVIDNKLKLKPSKCLIGAKEVTFLGHHISEKGIGQEPQKLKAIRNMPAPKDVNGVRRVLGLMSYYRKFVPNFATIAAPLIELTRKSRNFNWTTVEEKAFEELKRKLEENLIRAHYDPTCETIVKTDASRSGIGGILLQKQGGDFVIIECASRRLSSAEANYGITDLEGLAVIYSLQKFRVYLLGIKFKLLVDHCSLCVLKKKLPTSQRLHRWAILLAEFDFEVIYTKGSNHLDVDCLSRAPLEEDIDKFVEEKIFHLPLPANYDDWNQEFGDEDKEIVNSAEKKEDDLTIIDDIIYKGKKIYIPYKKRNQMMVEAHETALAGHGGQLVTENKLESCWWPNMKNDIRNFVASCEKCQRRKIERALPYGTMRHFQVFEPFEAWSLDTLGPITQTLEGHKYILVAVDVFSRWVEARAIRDLKAPTCAKFCRDLLSRFGPAKQIFTDHGPQFWNNLVGDTLKLFGTKQNFSTPDHPQGNAYAERTIQTITEKLFLNTEEEHSWNVLLPVTTFAINTSANKTTGYQPYEIIFGKKANCLQSITSLTNPMDAHNELLKNRLEKIRSNAIISQDNARNSSLNHYHRRNKEFNIDDWVWVRMSNKRRGKLEAKFVGPYQVTSKRNDIYELREERSNRLITRHIESLKPCVRRRSASIAGIMLCALLFFITVTSANFVFDRVEPVRWLTTNKIVFGRNVRVDLTLNVINPCDSLRKASKIILSNSSKNSSVETEVNRMLFECDKTFNETWVKVAADTVARCQSVENDQVYRRQWSAIAGGMMGGIFGAVTTDLVGTVWSYVNPYSDHNRLKATEGKVESLGLETKELLDAFRNTTASLVKGLHAISEDLQVHRTNLHELAGATPQFIWAAVRLMSHINLGTSHLMAIQDSCDKRQVNTLALSKLLQQPKLRKFDQRETSLVSITGTSNQLRFIFDAVEESIDTRLFVIDAFWIYDDLASKSVKRRYSGPEHVVWNHTAKCALGLDKWPEASRVLYRKCDQPGYNDPRLAEWADEAQVDFVTKQKQEVQQKSDSFNNLIYCFPGPIKLHNVSTTCPPYPFRLPKTIAFSCNNYSYTGQYNVKLSHDDDIRFRMAEVHGKDEPSVFEVELIMENERLRSINGFVNNIHEVIVEPKSVGFWLGAFVTIWILIAIIAVLCWWCCKTKPQPSTMVELNVQNPRMEKRNSAASTSNSDQVII